MRSSVTERCILLAWMATASLGACGCVIAPPSHRYRDTHGHVHVHAANASHETLMGPVGQPTLNPHPALPTPASEAPTEAEALASQENSPQSDAQLPPTQAADRHASSPREAESDRTTPPTRQSEAPSPIQLELEHARGSISIDETDCHAWGGDTPTATPILPPVEIAELPKRWLYRPDGLLGRMLAPRTDGVMGSPEPSDAEAPVPPRPKFHPVPTRPVFRPQSTESIPRPIKQPFYFSPISTPSSANRSR